MLSLLCSWCMGSTESVYAVDGFSTEDLKLLSGCLYSGSTDGWIGIE